MRMRNEIPFFNGFFEFLCLFFQSAYKIKTKMLLTPSRLIPYKRRYGGLTSKIGQIFAKFQWPG